MTLLEPLRVLKKELLGPTFIGTLKVHISKLNRSNQNLCKVLDILG